MATSIVDFVRSFNTREGRGCPVGAIEYVGGFSKKDIADAKKKGLIVSNKGTHGGFFPAGEVVVTKKAEVKSTLKGDMAAFLTAFANGKTVSREDAETLVARYNKECATKKESAKTRKAKDSK